MSSDDLMLMAYADGALNRRGRRDVERRLAHDQTLRIRLERLKQTAEVTRMSASLPECRTINEKIIGRVLARQTLPVSARWQKRRNVALLMFLLGVALGASGITFGQFKTKPYLQFGTDRPSIGSPQ